jgi:hypothetical protein
MHPTPAPPAKRLRLPTSGEVDDTNPDYLRLQEQALKALRNKWEGIFDKYGDMPAEKSDEVDLQTGKIVVDRGHIRNNRRAWESAKYLDDIIGRAQHTEPVEYNDDSEDELAPSILAATPAVKQKQKRRDKAPRSAPTVVQEQTRASIQSSPALQSTNHVDVAANPPFFDQNQLMNALGPALQFPQTPLSAHNQNALLIGLGQVVLQAVSHVLPQAQALTNQFGNTPILAPRSVPNFQITTASNPEETVAPPADPKWYFPPLPEVSNVSWKGLSNSVRPSTTAPQPRKADSLPKSSPLARLSMIVQDVPPTTEDNPEDSSDVRADNEELARDASSRPEKPRRQRRSRYMFSKEDDVYILEQRRVHTSPWSKIKNSRAKWRDWPLSAFHNHWFQQLQYTNRGLGSPKGRTIGKSGHAGSNAQEPEPSFSALEEPRQLLTPSSLEHAEYNDSSSSHQIATEGTTRKAGPTYSEEDLELLSLASAGEEQEEQQEEQDEEEEDITEKQEEASQQVHSPVIQETPPLEADYTSEGSVPPHDAIIPSIELRERVQEEYERQHVPTPRRANVHVQIPYKPHDTPVETQSQAHRAREDSDDLDLVPTEDVDELAAPCPATPRIKREHSTPSPSSLLATLSAKMPKSAPHLSFQSSSDRNSTPRPGQSKKDFARAVRIQWSKKSRKSTTLLKQQRSFEVLGKRKLADEDSGDELA